MSHRKFSCEKGATMRLTISEMAKFSGVSVRTLHYYDEINLLKPSEVVSETGYRYYDEQSCERLQQILFYRELDFPLKEIVQIMESSDYNKQDALKNQRQLLQLKRSRLDRLIGLLDASLKGEKTMSFNEFDKSEIEQAKEKYAKEALEKWGDTEAYKQNQEKISNYKKEDWNKATDTMNELIQEFSKHLGEAPECDEVQKLVGQWQQYITDYFYDCTDEILSGLGKMYVSDERFVKNMDKYASGTTQLISDAIEVYCK